MHLWKIKFSKEKYCVLHVGKVKGKHFTHEVYDDVIHQVDSTKYLGDIIHNIHNGKLFAIMADRVAKAVASPSIIQAIPHDIPLGNHRIKIGLDLRNALDLNSVLFNS